MAASASEFRDLPDEPHHPVSSFCFPKRSYGQKTTTQCNCKHQWFTSWPFLHYDEARDVVFCHVCVKAFSMHRIKTSHNAAASFVSYLYAFYHSTGNTIIV